jgi:hypothetical protein
MKPTIEPYSPLFPHRRERHMQRLSWLIAAALVSVMLWWSACMIYQGLQVTNSFTAAYERVISAVSGEK